MINEQQHSAPGSTQEGLLGYTHLQETGALDSNEYNLSFNSDVPLPFVEIEYFVNEDGSRRVEYKIVYRSIPVFAEEIRQRLLNPTDPDLISIDIDEVIGEHSVPNVLKEDGRIDSVSPELREIIQKESNY